MSDMAHSTVTTGPAGEGPPQRRSMPLGPKHVQHRDLRAMAPPDRSSDGATAGSGWTDRVDGTDDEALVVAFRQSLPAYQPGLDWFVNLFRTMPVAALMLDARGCIVDANQLCAEEFDLGDTLPHVAVPLARLMAREVDELRLGKACSRLVAGHTEELDDVSMVTLRGRLRWVDLRITLMPPRPTRDGSGCLLSMCVLNDRTAKVESRRVRDAVADAEHRRELAETAARAKTQLLARLSHELRTPLNAVIGFSHLLLNGPCQLDDKSRHRVSLILDSGHHLLALVEDVLELNASEAGRLPMQLGPCDLVSIARDVIDLHQPLADQLALRVVLAPCLEPVLVHANARRVREVLINLVSNAVKYNHRGGSVHLEVEVLADVVCLSVIDTGIGMSEFQLSHLFEPFNRLGADRTEVLGHGLGLSIARMLALAMGGDLRATSTPGEGSCFVLQLRRAFPPADHDVLTQPGPP